MLRAFLSGVSGLKSHQLRMDVIGNNIANASTVGFKASRVTFQEGFAQILAQASGPSCGQSAQGPDQVGGGVRLGGISTLFSQGTVEATGQPLDLAIQGEALFVVKGEGRTAYSRAGDFQLDPTGRLRLGGTGYVLQGTRATATGSVGGAVSDIVLPLNQQMAPKATQSVQLTGNLDASAEAGTEHTVSVTAYDTAGDPYSFKVTLTSLGDGGWTWKVAGEGGVVAPTEGGAVAFDGEGKVSSLTYPGGAGELSVTLADGDKTKITFDVDGTDGKKGLTARAGTTTATVASQDGRQAGDLINVLVGEDGVIQGVYSNGVTTPLAKIALATFTNPDSLVRAGDNVFEESAASGSARIGQSGTTTTSVVIAGALESSNVDITSEFADMIVTQRGFQANSRVITAADDMLSELINLWR
jgi:flagellar hook protein FlgE